MGFLHQLQVLLWKNFTLKKRNPLVVLFEIVIPLVLFFILVAIRRNKPILLKKEAFFMAQPLPSAGIIPVMQIFCPNAVRDPYGFPEHPKSEVTSFLNQLEDVITRIKCLMRILTWMGYESSRIPLLISSSMMAPLRTNLQMLQLLH